MKSGLIVRVYPAGQDRNGMEPIVLGMTIVVRAMSVGHGLHAGIRLMDPIAIGGDPLFKRAN